MKMHRITKTPILHISSRSVYIDIILWVVTCGVGTVNSSGPPEINHGFFYWVRVAKSLICLWFIVCHCGSFHFGHCIFFVFQYTVFDYFFDIVKRILTLLWKLLLTQIKDVHTLFNNSTLHKCLQKKKIWRTSKIRACVCKSYKRTFYSPKSYKRKKKAYK